jgi:hypothetical protein
MWAAVGGDRFELPELIVDADVGIADFPNFEASQASGSGGGHRLASRARWPEVHATLEGGGFGVGSDVEWAGLFRLDFKPTWFYF